MVVEDLLSMLSGFGVDEEVAVEIRNDGHSRALVPIAEVDALVLTVPEERVIVRLRT